MRSLRALLTEIVDYAGLFPPAALPMREAVCNYARYLDSEHSWMLGRFVLPLDRLSEFEEAVHDVPNGRQWRLTVLGSQSAEQDACAIHTFHARSQRALIDTVERKAQTPEEIREAASHLPPSLTVYYEIPIYGDFDALLPAIGAVRGRAKVRTGGVTSEAFPSLERVASFLHACVTHNVAFKATAGLHHAIRSEYPLSYEPGCGECTMHGFLNLFLAALWAAAGISREDMISLLEERDLKSINASDESIEWRGNSIDVEQIWRLRSDFVISFGSCSFDEPVAELQPLLGA